MGDTMAAARTDAVRSNQRLAERVVRPLRTMRLARTACTGGGALGAAYAAQRNTLPPATFRITREQPAAWWARCEAPAADELVIRSPSGGRYAGAQRHFCPTGIV